MTHELSPTPCLSVIYRPLAELKPDPRNARTHPKRQVDQIIASIVEFGFTNPVLTDPNLANQQTLAVDLVFVKPGSVSCALEPLRIAKKLDRYRDTGRIALEPWVVEAALERFGDRRLSLPTWRSQRSPSLLICRPLAQ